MNPLSSPFPERDVIGELDRAQPANVYRCWVDLQGGTKALQRGRAAQETFKEQLQVKGKACGDEHAAFSAVARLVASRGDLVEQEQE